MDSKHLELINQFFEAYGNRDIMKMRQLVDEKAKWIFPGQNPLSGTKTGLEEIVAFFDQMGEIMGTANIKVERLILAANDNYVVECQHVKTNREQGIDLDHQWCVLWRFEDGKIMEGKHLAENQYLADAFFQDCMK